MVSKKDLKEYEFKNIEFYFEYIIESIINGQNKQVHDLIKKLSIEQKKNALTYFKYYIEQNEFTQKAINKIIKSF